MDDDDAELINALLLSEIEFNETNIAASKTEYNKKTVDLEEELNLFSATIISEAQLKRGYNTATEDSIPTKQIDYKEHLDRITQAQKQTQQEIEQQTKQRYKESKQRYEEEKRKMYERDFIKIWEEGERKKASFSETIYNEEYVHIFSCLPLYVFGHILQFVINDDVYGGNTWNSHVVSKLFQLRKVCKWFMISVEKWIKSVAEHITFANINGHKYDKKYRNLGYVLRHRASLEKVAYQIEYWLDISISLVCLCNSMKWKRFLRYILPRFGFRKESVENAIGRDFVCIKEVEQRIDELKQLHGKCEVRML